MKKQILALLLLCTVFLGTCLPFAANASSESADQLTFSSFTQLKSFAARSYDAPTWLTYNGQGPLIIMDDLTLPEHLNLDVRGARLTVPSNVQFTASSRNFSGYLLADAVSVSGTMLCDNLSVSDDLKVDGVLTNNNLISITSQTQVTGADKIVHGQSWSAVSCLYQIASFSNLREVLSVAADASDQNWKYLLMLDQQDIAVSQSVSVPENCELYVSSQLTVAEGCVLDLNCRTWLYSPMMIDGVLINRGELNIQYTDGGRLNLQAPGTYVSEGTIACYSPSAVSLSEILTGFELSGFAVTTQTSPLFCRVLRDSCAHSIQNFVPVVTAPACAEQGYTTYTCPNCRDSYIAGQTAATGQHTYADDDDRDCDICGAQRDAAMQTAPLFRLYNPYTLEHLFTSSPEERDALAGIGWIFEGIAWYVPDSGIPVYRLYNPYDDSHFYTVSSEEIDTLLPLGWQLDGIMCYSTYPDMGEPILRLFNPYELKNYHHYTISKEECDMLVPLGWILEGTAWSGIPE